MPPSVLEDSNMRDAPSVGLDHGYDGGNDPAQPSPSDDDEDDGSDVDMEKSAVRFFIPSKTIEDLNMEAKNTLPNQIGHLKIQSRSGYAKLTPEEFRQRRNRAGKLAALQQDGYARALPRAVLQTGLCYDVRMRFHATLDEEDVHPEDPRRIHVIYQALRNAGLTESPESGQGPEAKGDLMRRIRAREVTEDEACLVHIPEHWEFLTTLPDLDREALLDLTRTGDSVFYNQQSFACAKLSCGGSIETCGAVWRGDVKNAIAVVRPPGHHAEPHKSMGFCLFNNVAVAARAMQKAYPDCKKILILDWDVHHGNGTQTAFYEDDTVLYVSLHRFEDGTFYPPHPDGDLNYCGEGKGLGFNVNIPWETGGIGDADYIYAFQRVVMPIAYEYEPDLVIISAGFDAAAGDKIGECYVTPAGYAHMTHMLMSLANGKVAVCLEGGYNLASISNSALAVTKTLLGEPPEPLHSVHASPKVQGVVHRVIIEQSQYWKCMDFKTINNRLAADNIRAKRLHDILRQYQARMLFDNFGMSSLLVVRPQYLTSPTFEDQVLSTPNYDKVDTLFLIVHDSVDLVTAPEAGKYTIQTHNSFMLDSSTTFVEWACGQGYGVIDVNVPKFITPPEESDASTQTLSSSSTFDDTNTVVLMLWDNYIDLADADNIVLIGIGEAYRSLLNLISLRDCTNRVAACVSFISKVPLCAVNTTRDENVGPWYFKHSQVYVPQAHDVWAQPKRPKSKYGSLVSVSENDLDSVVQVNRDAAITFIKAMFARRAS